MTPEKTNNIPNPLPPGYYLDNFMTLLNYVLEQYKQLLHQEEIEFVVRFKALSLNSQRLYVRLISRKGPCFRTDKLRYDEIENLEGSVKELDSTEFISVNPREDMVSVLDVITRTELIELINKSGFPNTPENYKAINKPALIEFMLELDESKLWEALEKKWTFIFPLHDNMTSIFFLLFFGNMEQTLSDFILEDIGVLRYELYEIRKEDRLFQERDVIDGYISIYNLRTLLWNAMEMNDLEQVRLLGKMFREVRPPEGLRRKVEKSYNEIGRFLEKFQIWDEALNYYEMSSLTPSRERRVRVLDKTGLIQESFNLANQVLADPASEEEREFAVYFCEKMKRKLGLPYQAAQREKFDETELILKKLPEDKIESITLNHFFSEGKMGFNSENGIWTALFGLAFWDVVFMSLPGVFFNPFQRGPTDLHTLDFYEKRKDKINECLNHLNSDKNWQDKLLKRYEEKKNTANFLVPWKRIDHEQINQVLSWIPKKDILHILERMAGRLREFRSGFPDLIIYDPLIKKYTLVEVKGPGDQMRPNQKRWFRFFEEKKIPCTVARIKWES